MWHLRKLTRWRLPLRPAAVLTLGIALAAGSSGLYFWLRPCRIAVRGTTLEFVPLGDVDPKLVRAIAEGTAQVYGIACRAVADSLPLPSAAYDTERRRYLADKLLDHLKGAKTRENVHMLAVTEADMTVGDMNFVFGLAEMPGDAAVMSLARLRPKAPTQEAPQTLIDRGVKIAVHELGHSFGFDHCPNEQCVMHYADTAAGVDLTSKTLCARCGSRLR